MHCDDKRTVAALKQYILEATTEIQDLLKRQKIEQNDKKKTEIKNRINYLEKMIRDSKEQLSSMI